MLSPDAPDLLDTIVPENSVYVIGAIVDRTKKKNVTLKKSIERGVTAVRLPIKETLQDTRTLILNVNTVYEILHHKADGKEWSEVFDLTIPKRHFKTKS